MDAYNEKNIFPLPDVDSLRVDSILKISFSGQKRAAIYYRIAFYSKKQKKQVTFNTGDRLILKKNGWKINEVISSQ